MRGKRGLEAKIHVTEEETEVLQLGILIPFPRWASVSSSVERGEGGLILGLPLLTDTDLFQTIYLSFVTTKQPGWNCSSPSVGFLVEEKGKILSPWPLWALETFWAALSSPV